MEKLQAMLDQAFGSAKGPREPERPSAAFLERERAFAVRAQKIEALRQARVTAEGPSAAHPLVFEVVRYRGHWRTLHRDRYSSPYPDQAAAVHAAKTAARKKRDLGHAVEVLLRRTDGQTVAQTVDDDQDASATAPEENDRPPQDR
jgi:inosine-uridine nucleoside N-ribohydrolase